MAVGKKIKTTIKLQVQAGAATAAQPVGPALGQHGLNIMEFVNAFNEQTRPMGDVLVPVLITVYEDRTFSFVTKTPPASFLIKKEAGLEKGSGVPNREKVGKLSKAQVAKIAEMKMKDLNARDLATAAKIIAGTARSMGVEVEK